MREGERLPVILLFGPTASGKTEVLERLFAGTEARFPAEIVSADSMQVYRGMDIGTAKPEAELRRRLPHHLIDIRDPGQQFNVGDFVRHADEACLDIAYRGRLPVVSGGTGFYLKHFMLGLPSAPPSDPEVRETLRGELAERGAADLLLELARVDPESARRIHVNDEYRLLRALEVFRVSGLPLSAFPKTGNPALGSPSRRPAYRFLPLGIHRERAELYRRIDERTAAMFKAGLGDEVARLVAAGYGPEDPGLRAIGYREFFLEDGSLNDDLADVADRVARNSRRYAKRQETFFASLPGVRWLNAEVDGPSLSEAVARELATFLVPSVFSR